MRYFRFEKIFPKTFFNNNRGLSFTCYDYFQGGKHVKLAERREAEMEILCRKKQVTYRELAQEFGVSRETIRKDILDLMCSYPIETVRGRYGGGVKILPGFSIQPKTLNREQVAFLEGMRSRVTSDELEVLSSILDQFTP